MPKTIAVRKAKETTAASTLSLILNSIWTSFAGMSRLSGAGSATPRVGVYGCFGGIAKQFSMCSGAFVFDSCGSFPGAAPQMLNRHMIVYEYGVFLEVYNL